MAARPIPEIVRHVSELFAPLGTIRCKAMFGGWGFYCDELFFALIADETLYLKADAQNVSLFEAAGGEPFRYTRSDGRVETMAYWTVPEEALEHGPAMLPWAREALAAAVRQRKKPK
jgi:DNA transformation protein